MGEAGGVDSKVSWGACARIGCGPRELRELQKERRESGVCGRIGCGLR